MFPSWNARAVGLRMSAEEVIKTAADAGFTGVDLLVRDLLEDGEDPRQLRRRMTDLGLRGGAWPLPVRWRGESTRFEADLKALPALAEAAQILGLTRTGTWVLPEVDPTLLTPGHRAEDAQRLTLQLHLDRLGTIAELLDRYDCRLGLEIMGPATARSGRGAPFVQKYAEFEPMLGTLRREHRNVGVLADSFHLFAADEDVSAAWVWGGDAIVWAHLADAAHDDRSQLEDGQRVWPGETGHGVSRALLKALLDHGYDGPVTAEPLSTPLDEGSSTPAGISRRALAALKAVWPE